MTEKKQGTSLFHIERDPDYIRKIETLAIFAGSIAHDYNNALTVVLGNLSLAKLEAQGNSELMEILKDADSAAGRIKKLTERLADFSKGLKTGKTRFTIKELLDSYAGRPLPGFQGDFNVEIKDGTCQIEGDRDLIDMALQSVIINAAEAASGSTGVISITAGVSNVNEHLFFKETEISSGQYANIKIADNGNGIEEGDINYIFNPYFTTKPGHDGLGLALSYAVIKKQRGFIKAESENGKGTVLSIYLPLV